MQHLDEAATGNETIVDADEPLINPHALKDAMSRVFADDNSYNGDCDFCTNFKDIGMESLQVAELIMELEEITGHELELDVSGRLETLGDLCRALRPVGELP